MAYTPERAAPYIGKRVIVTVRNIHADRSETVDRFYGIIESAHEHGLVLRVEGEGEDKYWVMPPELDWLVPAPAQAYRMEDSDEVIEQVDYVASYVSTESVDLLPP